MGHTVYLSLVSYAYSEPGWHLANHMGNGLKAQAVVGDALPIDYYEVFRKLASRNELFCWNLLNGKIWPLWVTWSPDQTLARQRCLSNGTFLGMFPGNTIRPEASTHVAGLITTAMHILGSTPGSLVLIVGACSHSFQDLNPLPIPAVRREGRVLLGPQPDFLPAFPTVISLMLMGRLSTDVNVKMSVFNGPVYCM